MPPLRALLLTPPSRSLHPTERSYLHTGMKPQFTFFPLYNRSFVFKSFRTLPFYVCCKFFIRRSCENCRGGGLFFPFWNSSSCPSELPPTNSKDSSLTQLPQFSASGAAACGDSFLSLDISTCTNPQGSMSLSRPLFSTTSTVARPATPLLSAFCIVAGGVRTALLRSFARSFRSSTKERSTTLLQSKPCALFSKTPGVG
jgi:hypothetical protein